MKDKVSARDDKQPQRTGGLEETKKLLIVIDHSFNLKCFLNFLSVKSYLTFQDKIIPSRNTLLSNAFGSEPSTCHLCSCTVYQNLLFLTAYSSIEYQHIFKLRYLSGINFISPKLIQFH